MPEDLDAIAEHRARMFDEMGEVPPGAFEILRAKSRERLHDLLNRGEYIGWLAIPTQRPDIIVGGAGVQLREVLPHGQTQPGRKYVETSGDVIGLPFMLCRGRPSRLFTAEKLQLPFPTGHPEGVRSLRSQLFLKPYLFNWGANDKRGVNGPGSSPESVSV
jgi:hypothetical protein